MYFYTDRDRTVSVRVRFPKGIMTDWYPEASRPPTQELRWDELRILAKERPALKEERDTKRYFAAREVDAVSVQATDSNRKKENEKFLFYRGVGDFEMPFVVRALGNGKFTVKNTGKRSIPGQFLVHVEDRKEIIRRLLHCFVQRSTLVAAAIRAL